MFRKEESGEIETIIGPSVQVEGNFIANGDIIIEGVVSGNIQTEKNLRVGEQAKIFANISAANALIAGEVQGNVRVDGSLELTGTAKVFGDVRATVLTIGSGAVLHGKCSAGEEKKSRFEKVEDYKKVDKNIKPKEKPLTPLVEKVK
ncbi:MAG: polymer-forming cytoskeletal protein [Candidatus Buchananbacteria bacterium]|nr:polymer-forming cytoskeletal protein [Candidatus Buchananbacteria bacterium]